MLTLIQLSIQVLFGDARWSFGALMLLWIGGIAAVIPPMSQVSAGFAGSVGRLATELIRRGRAGLPRGDHAGGASHRGGLLRGDRMLPETARVGPAA